MAKVLEIWRPINDAPGFTISNMGRVQDLVTGDVMELWPDEEEGYLSVWLVDGEGHTYLAEVARLVAEAFLEPVEEDFDVMHIDGDPFNCEVWNLQWAHWSEIHHPWNWKYTYCE